MVICQHLRILVQVSEQVGGAYIKIQKGYQHWQLHCLYSIQNVCSVQLNCTTQFKVQSENHPEVEGVCQDLYLQFVHKTFYHKLKSMQIKRNVISRVHSCTILKYWNLYCCQYGNTLFLPQVRSSCVVSQRNYQQKYLT